MRPLVSVIIPAYNVEKYIGKTLKSVFEQDFRDFEVIIVNDGSTDRTDYVIRKVLRRFTKERYDIKVKYIPLSSNKGVSVARNTGLENSEGDFIIFLDGDDTMAKNAISTLYELITETTADIAWGQYVVVDENDNYLGRDSRKFVPEGLVAGEDMLINIFLRRSWIAMWAAIYRKNLIDKWGIKFTPGAVRAQDTEFLFKYLFLSKKVKGTTNIVVNYRQRSGSATRIVDRRLFHIYASYKRILNYFKKHNAPDNFILLFWNVFFSSIFVNSILIPIIRYGTNDAKISLRSFLLHEDAKDLLRNFLKFYNSKLTLLEEIRRFI